MFDSEEDMLAALDRKEITAGSLFLSLPLSHSLTHTDIDTCLSLLMSLS